MSLQRLDVKTSELSGLLEHLEMARGERALLDEKLEDLAERVRRLGLGVCRSCYCTDLTACEPPCSWVEPDLCSECGQQ